MRGAWGAAGQWRGSVRDGGGRCPPPCFISPPTTDPWGILPTWQQSQCSQWHSLGSGPLVGILICFFFLFCVFFFLIKCSFLSRGEMPSDTAAKAGQGPPASGYNQPHHSFCTLHGAEKTPLESKKIPGLCHRSTGRRAGMCHPPGISNAHLLDTGMAVWGMILHPCPCPCPHPCPLILLPSLL